MIKALLRFTSLDYAIVLTTIFMVLTVSGCATAPGAVTAPIELPKVQAPAEIMGDCASYIKLTDGTMATLAKAYVDNSKLFYQCKLLNAGKKAFIERQGE